MTFDWRELSPQQMECHFNPRAAISDAQQLLESFVGRSKSARDKVNGIYDIRYGANAKETLDIHQPQGVNTMHPLVIFIHGGYWRGLDKSDHSFVAPPILDSGAILANVNYDLCPTVTLDTIVEEIANALRFCHANASSWGADPQALYLFGHSAGAHLVAEMMLYDWSGDESLKTSIRGAVALTGVYEPEVILSVSVNEEACVSPDTARRRNCLNRALTLRPPTVIAAGSDEPDGWMAQSIAFHARCLRHNLDASLHVCKDANHFTVLDHALDNATDVGSAVFSLWA